MGFGFRLTKKYCNYLDWTLEDVPRVFYVGEGTQKRANNGKRNRVHSGLVRRFGMRREIVEEFDSRTEALTRETERILFYGTFAPVTEWGANLKLRETAPTCVVPTLESNLKRSIALRGRPKQPFTDEHKRNIGVSSRGRKLKPETKLMMSAVRRGRKQSESHLANLALSRGRKRFRLRALGWFRRSLPTPARSPG
jgi:hypothetical protein